MGRKEAFVTKTCIILICVLRFVLCNNSHHSKSSNDDAEETDSSITDNTSDQEDTTDDGDDITYISKEVNPSDYPEMSDEIIGQLKWALKIADDELEDFSRIPSLNIFGIPWTGLLEMR